jgi:hypothetical protein
VEGLLLSIDGWKSWTRKGIDGQMSILEDYCVCVLFIGCDLVTDKRSMIRWDVYIILAYVVIHVIHQ